MNKIGSKALQLIVSVYGLLYAIGFIFPLLTGDGASTGMGDLERNTIVIAFLVYVTGAVAAWFHEKWGGLILSCWHVLVWAFCLLIWPDAGMILILIFPVIFPASFLIVNWYTKNTENYPTTIDRQHLTLQVFSSNFAAVYGVIFLSDLVPRSLDLELPTRVDELNTWDLNSPLGWMLLLSFLAFFVAYAFSWRKLLVPGILFVLWYAHILLLSSWYFEFANSGPWNLFGVPVLVLGVLYLKLYQEKRREARVIS